ncbi:4'-phosphopantetheinyl transferase [Cryobacterium sp. MP_M5]|uniref:4'-phosphopantetheinyl transferase family protein n=1 Tax=unclassified Cryobacterium TaxID=2649013 RepID=UPI0018CB54AB|nr:MULTISPECIES: 4'-phosphopantetheinyl transferase superfamily protein [unclassified Cryobacterium]MBG6058826.1 4'-phosphopantetheinyl transferase [Cryobacterium sp. MP_M3]MEC5177165.1 4'-phosphopantetheinyl transferase [Cryobacterium sp. MP_M5]
MTDERTPDVFVVVGPRGETDAADRAFLLAAAGWVLGSVPSTLSLDRRCPTCGGADHGRPFVRGAGIAAGGTSGTGRRLDVSLSRAGATVGVALSFAGPVGIDIESVDAVGRAGFDDVAFNPVELAALAELPAGDAARARAEIWTGKEAALKAVGVGLREDPRTLTVRLPRPGEVHPHLRAQPGHALPRVLPRLAAFDAGPGLAGTVAVFTAAEPAVRVLPTGRIRGLTQPVTEAAEPPD